MKLNTNLTKIITKNHKIALYIDDKSYYLTYINKE